ncbi:MAG: hypothetical protein AAF493_25850, partial [Pseudomonadota bacterium]
LQRTFEARFALRQHQGEIELRRAAVHRHRLEAQETYRILRNSPRASSPRSCPNVAEDERVPPPENATPTFGRTISSLI